MNSSHYWKYIFNEMVGILYIILGVLILQLKVSGIIWGIAWGCIVNGIVTIIVAAVHRYRDLEESKHGKRGE